MTEFEIHNEDSDEPKKCPVCGNDLSYYPGFLSCDSCYYMEWRDDDGKE